MTRRRGNAIAWIIVLLLLLALAGVMAYKIIDARRAPKAQPTTQPDPQ